MTDQVIGNNLQRKLQVIDNLTSVSPTEALSANQGRELNDKLLNFKAASTFYVNELTGNDTENSGLTANEAFLTPEKGWQEVHNSGQVKILGSDTYNVSHTMASSLSSVKTTLDDGAKITGTLNLVSGNTSMYFFGGMFGATLNDASTGTVYLNNNVGGATLNFTNAGYKVVRGSTSTPAAINLSGTGGTLYIENVSGGVIPITIGTGWTVYTVNSLLAVVSNSGVIVDGNSTTVNSMVENQTALNAITAVTNNTLDGLYALNFASPSVTGLSLKKGDIIYKVGVLHMLSYPFEVAPSAISRAISATNREVFVKATDSWVSFDAKADKVTTATVGHIATFDSQGNPVDSGATIADVSDGWDGEVNTFADLPAASSSNNGQKYVVKTPTGTIILGTKKYAGTYISDGTTWNIFGYKQASVINQLLTGFAAHASVASIVATDSILQAFQKVQTSLNAKLAKDSNLSDIPNKQTALNTITDVANAGDNQVLAKDPTSGNLKFSDISGSLNSGRIEYSAANHTAVFYGADITLTFPTVATNEGTGLSYSNGIFTVSKDCVLKIFVFASWRNNGSVSDDTCSYHIQRSTDGGTTYGATTADDQYLTINPSEMVDSSRELAQSIGASFALDSGDKFRVRLTGVSLSQYLEDQLIVISGYSV